MSDEIELDIANVGRRILSRPQRSLVFHNLDGSRDDALTEEHERELQDAIKHGGIQSGSILGRVYIAQQKHNDDLENKMIADFLKDARCLCGRLIHLTGECRYSAPVQYCVECNCGKDWVVALDSTNAAAAKVGMREIT